MPKDLVTLSNTAQKQLDKLDDHIVQPIIEAISILAENPRPNGYKTKGTFGL